jgi:hypothetical protein
MKQDKYQTQHIQINKRIMKAIQVALLTEPPKHYHRFHMFIRTVKCPSSARGPANLNLPPATDSQLELITDSGPYSDCPLLPVTDCGP